jgi:hypothetical protein
MHSSSWLGDTWEWDGATWVQRAPLASPAARQLHALAYDAARQRVVLSGGHSGGWFHNGDTWEWDGVSWVQRSPATSPSARAFHALAYDAVRQRVVLFGGLSAIAVPGAGLQGDTWLLGDLVPAVLNTIGNACVGTNGPPIIASDLPFLGNQTFVVDLLSARASAPCLFVLGTGTQARSLGGGCTLYVDGDLLPVFSTTNASGFSSIKLPIPLDPVLRGHGVYAQAFVLDPMGSFAGLAMSAGRKLVLGD